MSKLTRAVSNAGTMNTAVNIAANSAKPRKTCMNGFLIDQTVFQMVVAMEEQITD